MNYLGKNYKVHTNVNFKYSIDLRRCIVKQLRKFRREPLTEQNLRSAAVAIVIVGGYSDHEASVVLTRRPVHLKNHSGQFALPGGKIDIGETGPNAALRELHEELGLHLDANEVIGCLDEYPTRSGFRILPVVVWGGYKPTLTPNPAEIAGIFHIPLTELDNPNLCKTTKSDNAEHLILSVNLPTAGGYVYAPTAAILYQFREVALRGKQTRVKHFDQPQFAWK